MSRDNHTVLVKAALRARCQDRIILVGELRDLETVRSPSNGETGHLVFGTLHTSTRSTAIAHRSISRRSPGKIRVMLSESSKGVICRPLQKIGAGASGLEIPDRDVGDQ